MKWVYLSFLVFVSIGCSKKIIQVPQDKEVNSGSTSTVGEISLNSATASKTTTQTQSVSVVFTKNSFGKLTLSTLSGEIETASSSDLRDLGNEVRIAMSDMNLDGIADYVLASGPGVNPRIKVLSGTDYSVLSNFSVPISNQNGGLFISVCDANEDGRKEIIVGADRGGLPTVLMLDGTGNVLSSFLAYAPEFYGGVRVACGDVRGDGRDEIITGAGRDGGPHIRVFDGVGTVLSEFMAFDSAYRGGVFVTTGNVLGDGKREIIVGNGGNSLPEVRIYDAVTMQLVRSFAPYPASFTGGVRVATRQIRGDVQINGDLTAEILTMPGPGLPPTVSIFDSSFTKILETAVNSQDYSVGGYLAGY